MTTGTGPVRPAGRSAGFTLVEVIVVLALLGVAAAVAVLAIGTQPGTGAQKGCVADFNAVQTAVDSYRQQTGVFPGGALPSAPPLVDTAVPSTTGSSPGIDALLGTITVTSGTPPTVTNTTIGPWMRDDPVSTGHYEIQVANDGSGTIGVYNTGPYPTAQIGSTNTASDCSSVR